MYSLSLYSGVWKPVIPPGGATLCRVDIANRVISRLALSASCYSKCPGNWGKVNTRLSEDSTLTWLLREQLQPTRSAVASTCGAEQSFATSRIQRQLEGPAPEQ